MIETRGRHGLSKYEYCMHHCQSHEPLGSIYMTMGELKWDWYILNGDLTVTILQLKPHATYPITYFNIEYAVLKYGIAEISVPWSFIANLRMGDVQYDLPSIR